MQVYMYFLLFRVLLFYVLTYFIYVGFILKLIHELSYIKCSLICKSWYRSVSTNFRYFESLIFNKSTKIGAREY